MFGDSDTMEKFNNVVSIILGIAIAIFILWLLYKLVMWIITK
jgi:hypothetical protein